MSEDNFERHIKFSELFLKESDVSEADHSDLWLNVDEVLPVRVFDSEQLISVLSSNGIWKLNKDEEFRNDLKGLKVSKLVLTFGRDQYSNEHYEVGFFDGNRFRELSGYGLFPPPSHWMPFPKSPQIKK